MPDHKAFAPNLVESPGFGRRAHGVAVTAGTYDGRGWDGEDRTAQIEFKENGRLFLASERGVCSRTRPDVPTPPPAEVVFETLILGHTKLLVRLTATVSQSFGFTGSWRFGLLLTGLRGANRSSSVTTSSPATPRRTPNLPMNEPLKRRPVDLINDPRATVKHLVGPLWQSLGSHHAWESFFAA
ncbi:hypothetical protein AB0E01_18175 [Nocardia vinacea]|uniref:hypothetical protein n=1 Tax=Nocardia vinacea TaxID=96468 RepID=UPI0033CC723A